MATKPESPWSAGVAQPAHRALAAGGFTKLEDLTKISEKELAKLHGMGSKAIRLLGEALAAKGLSFANEN